MCAHAIDRVREELILLSEANPRRILVADDEPLIRLDLREMLAGLGYQVVGEASDGLTAVRLARETLPDLVIMDIQMPEMDGYETAQRFKRDPALADIPLIGVSSFAMVGDRAKALQAGFAGYIEKPINTDTFARDVTRFLKNQPTRS